MSTTDKNASPARGGLSEWGWFFAWVALGVALALGAVSFGPLLLVAGGILGFVLARRTARHSSEVERST